MVQTRDVYGISIPISAGERAFEGHIIWASDYYQTQIVEPFPSEVVNGVTTVWGSIAHDILAVDFAVSLGYHLIPEDERGEVAIFKMWADDQLIYDASQPTLVPTDYSFTFHKGESDQDIDPVMQAAIIERTTAFRNQLYVVFKGWPLATADVAGANVVVPGGPTPWIPTHFPLGVLPVIRVELVDGLTVTSGTTDFTMLAGSGVWPDGIMFDWENDLGYAFSAVNTAAASLHTFDLISQVELSSVPVIGTYTNLTGLDSVSLHDHNNQVAIGAKNGVGNTSPIVAIDLQSGAINDTFGVSSAQLTPSDTTPESTLDSGNPIANIPYPLTGDIAYLLDGQITRSVAVFGSFSGDVSFLPVQDGGVFPNGLGLPEKDFDKGGAAIALPVGETINFIAAYPFDKFGDSVAGSQDGLVLVGAGTNIYGIQFGFRQVNSVSVCKVLGFGLVLDLTVDFTGYEAVLGVVDPNDRGMVFFLKNGSDWKAVKYSSTMYDYFPITGGGWGSTSSLGDWKGRWPDVDHISVFPSRKQWDKVVTPLNTTNGYMNSLRESNLTGGTYAWNDASNHHILDLATGNTTTVATGLANINDFVWDSRTGSFYFPHGGTNSRPLGIFSVGNAAGTTATIGDICRWILLYVGFTADQISIDAALTDPVTGFLLDHPRALEDLMRDLGETYNFQYFNSEGIAKVIRTTQAVDNDPGDAAFDLTIPDLCPVQENQVSQNDNLVTVLAAPNQQVGAVSIQYSDLDQTFSWQVQTFNEDIQSSGSVANGKLVLDLPIVMHRAEAFKRATKIQIKKTAQTDTHYFRLSQAYMQLEPSDLVTITKAPFRYGIRLDEATFNGDWSMSLSGSSFLFQDDVQIADESTDGTGDTGRGFGNADAKPVALDIPLLYQSWAGSDGTIIMTVGEFTYGQTTFSGAPLVFGLAPIGPFSNVGLITVDAKYGIVVGTLADTDLPFTTDNTTVLRIALRTGTVDGQWASTDADGLLNGLNTILVGADGRWEAIYFRDVTKITDKVLTISGLLRGRRGTEVNCGTHQPNDQVILVQSVATGFQPGLRPQIISDDNLAALLTYDARGIPNIRPRTPINVRVAGLSEYPWAPNEIRAKIGSHFNVVASPSYSNPGGTGDRTHLITVTANFVQTDGTLDNLVDGLTANNGTASIGIPGGLTDAVMTFDFSPLGLPQIITEYVWGQNNSVSQGHYTFEGSNDSSSWDTIDANSELGGASSTTTVSFSNSTGYLYYRLRQISGTTSNSPWCHEIEFKTESDVDPNDLIFTWQRRDRVDSGFFVEDAVELNDLAEYKFQALLSGTVVHTADDLVLQTYRFTEADQATAGFSAPLAAIDVKVYQKSSLVGPGLARTTTIDVE